MNIFCLRIIDHFLQSDAIEVLWRFICTSLLHYRYLAYYYGFFPSLPRSLHTRLQQITIYYSDIEKGTKKFLHYVIKALSLGTFAYFLFLSLVFYLIYVCQECEETFDISFCCRSKGNVTKSLALRRLNFTSNGNWLKVDMLLDSRVGNYKNLDGDYVGNSSNFQSRIYTWVEEIYKVANSFRKLPPNF